MKVNTSHMVSSMSKPRMQVCDLIRRRSSRWVSQFLTFDSLTVSGPFCGVAPHGLEALQIHGFSPPSEWPMPQGVESRAECGSCL